MLCTLCRFFYYLITKTEKKTGFFKATHNLRCLCYSCCNAQIRHQFLHRPWTTDRTNPNQVVCNLYVCLFSRLALGYRIRYRDFKRFRNRRRRVHVWRLLPSGSCWRNFDLRCRLRSSATWKVKGRFGNGSTCLRDSGILLPRLYRSIRWEQNFYSIKKSF